jgi:hypothetical protein
MKAYCPTHGSELDGEPGTYTCRFGHSVNTADATTESGRPQL